MNENTDVQAAEEESDATTWRRDLGFEEQELYGSKRCGVQWTPWMGDWFSSWSPRNSNSNAEGQWDHWVDLALRILSDPLTKIVRPGSYIEPADADVRGFYDEAGRGLTDDELMARFRRGA